VGEIAFIPGGQRIESRGEADGGVSWSVAFAHDGGTWDLERGTLALGGAALADAETRGLHIRGNVDDIRFDDWLRLSRGDETRTGTADRIRSIDVNVDSLRVLGQHLEKHRVRVDRSARDWLVQFEGAQVTGSVFVPYDLDSNRAVVLDMERLVLPGDGEQELAEQPEQIDPRKLPPITLNSWVPLKRSLHERTRVSWRKRSSPGTRHSRLPATPAGSQIRPIRWGIAATSWQRSPAPMSRRLCGASIMRRASSATT
jgi:hypothetical protein